MHITGKMGIKIRKVHFLKNLQLLSSFKNIILHPQFGSNCVGENRLSCTKHNEEGNQPFPDSGAEQGNKCSGLLYCCLT